MTTVDELIAVYEISRLKARYFRCVDGKDWKQLRELFTPDATLFFPETQEHPANLDESIKLISSALEGMVSIHQGYMPDIEILGPTEARGIWGMEDRIYSASPGPNILNVEFLQGMGHYHEDYRKVDGRWLIHRLKVTRLRVTSCTPPRAVT